MPFGPTSHGRVRRTRFKIARNPNPFRHLSSGRCQSNDYHFATSTFWYWNSRISGRRQNVDMYLQEHLKAYIMICFCVFNCWISDLQRFRILRDASLSPLEHFLKKRWDPFSGGRRIRLGSSWSIRLHAGFLGQTLQVSTPRLRTGISGPVADEIKGQAQNRGDGRSIHATGRAASIRTQYGATQQGDPCCRKYQPPHDVFIPRACCQVCKVACHQAVIISACALKKKLQLPDILSGRGKARPVKQPSQFEQANGKQLLGEASRGGK
ncbi:hypothetical protein CSKR_111137 [Clonorchis sinensis]|uniref:Uncharacterized protein n=1 Tax=Clonorchis sinensis TaxID=79923 RepID=A0A419Q3G9_CLOSI|nr:hypothetical protein CSKR_111137 [Clonorchis sinensis]